MAKKKRPAVTPPAGNVWVVDTDHLCLTPRITRHVLIEARVSGVKVRFLGAEKFVPNAVGRKFFTDKNEMRAWCTKWMWEKYEKLQASSNRVLEAINTFDGEVGVLEARSEPYPKNEKINYLDD